MFVYTVVRYIYVYKYITAAAAAATAKTTITMTTTAATMTTADRPTERPINRPASVSYSSKGLIKIYMNEMCCFSSISQALVNEIRTQTGRKLSVCGRLYIFM